MRLMQMLPVSRTFASEMNRLQQELENVFSSRVSTGFPAVNIWEDDEHYYLETELPGYQPSDLEAFVVNQDQLVLKGERKPTTYEKAICHRQERSFGSFERTFTLPKQVDANNVQAKYTNGILELKLAKSPESKPKKINIAIN
ncbi:MAG TPA: Hsp20/alpha crystallin family protein [Gemmatales bacterium]|nr:Hsp20/alpha crystallin family protein [Gemmatales bacterium]HMP16505.1 Hsp20/alpha crystallin family protein [Gemmatales bacterium]